MVRKWAQNFGTEHAEAMRTRLRAVFAVYIQEVDEVKRAALQRAKDVRCGRVFQLSHLLLRRGVFATGFVVVANRGSEHGVSTTALLCVNSDPALSMACGRRSVVAWLQDEQAAERRRAMEAENRRRVKAEQETIKLAGGVRALAEVDRIVRTVSCGLCAVCIRFVCVWMWIVAVNVFAFDFSRVCAVGIYCRDVAMRSMHASLCEFACVPLAWCFAVVFVSPAPETAAAAEAATAARRHGATAC